MSERQVIKERAKLFPQVSAFCTELTGWTAEALAQGSTFTKACEVLRRDYHSDSRPWASWGDYDRKILSSQCQRFGVPYPMRRQHTNAKKVFSEALGLKKRPGMAQALEHLGLMLEGRHHNGADDAWNIAAIAAELLRRFPGTIPA